MNKEDVINLLSNKIKLIRADYEFTQEEMSNVIGVSKKSLVEIEKGRKMLSWPVAVTVCAIFSDSEIIKMTLGDEPVELISLIALGKSGMDKRKTLGGIVWWKELSKSDEFILQQNIISGHYRILDNKRRRWYSSIDSVYINKKYKELVENNNLK